jgi:hypothetical protein
MSSSTRALVEPGLVGARELGASNERLAAAVVDGVLERMRGRSINWAIGDRTLRAVVNAARLRRKGLELQLQVDLDVVTWGEWPFSEVSAVATSLRLDPYRPGSLGTSGVDVVGLTMLEPLLTWLRQHLRSWILEADQNGRIKIVRRRLGMGALIEAVAVEQGALEAQLYAVCWRGIRLTLPARLRPTRFIELPPLPRGASIVEARRQGDEVRFRLTIPALRWSVEPSGLKLAAMLPGAPNARIG